MSTLQDTVNNWFRIPKKSWGGLLETLFEDKKALIGLTVGPATLLMLFASFLPILWALNLSLYDAGALSPTWTWVGTQNYVEVINSPAYWDAFWRSVSFGFGSVAVQLVVGVGTALMLSREFRGVVLARAMIFLPYLIPTVVVGMVFRLMLNGNYGIINVFLIDIGLINQPIGWLTEGRIALPTLIVANSWKFAIFITIMVLARLQSIPNEFYEAATMNGAGPLRKFRDITFPQIKGVILLTLLLRGIWMFNKFDIIYIMTTGGPGQATTTLPIYIFEMAFLNFRLGQAGAIAGTLFGFLGIGAIVYFVGFNPAEEVGR
ncbi:carbohydrate ABC transporter permease [Haloplanus halophilus]|uniref:carbohydrate ABC transporter permease n=1 Tax=Haloplanus halophilus TaxID=2949993 RepID=UPI00203AB79F|nr:sugar ABC transporter permease [Haloplanus sp. GDY1]